MKQLFNCDTQPDTFLRRQMEELTFDPYDASDLAQANEKMTSTDLQGKRGKGV